MTPYIISRNSKFRKFHIQIQTGYFHCVTPSLHSILIFKFNSTMFHPFRLNDDEIKAKVDAYRNTLMGNQNGNGSGGQVKDEHGRLMWVINWVKQKSESLWRKSSLSRARIQECQNYVIFQQCQFLLSPTRVGENPLLSLWVLFELHRILLA